VSPCAVWEGSVAMVQRVSLYGDGSLGGFCCNGTASIAVR
jgi:hypothetical protein